MERSKVGLLLAKIESAYGTDPTPSASLNVIATMKSQMTWGPEFDAISRDILDGGLGLIQGDNVLPRVKFSLSVEMRGNRTNGSTPDISAGSSVNKLEIDPLLQACDLNPTYTAESSGGARDGYVVYRPTVPIDEGKSVTIYFYSEKKLHKVLGCKGNVKGNLSAGRYGQLDFEFQGLYGGVSDTALPSGTFLDTKPAIWKASGSTIDAWSGFVGTKVDFDLGNSIARRDDGQSTDGVKGFSIFDRASTFGIDIESVAEATHPVWADLKAGTFKTLVTNLNNVSGNRFQLTLTGQLNSAPYGDANGNRMNNLKFRGNRSALSTALGQDFLLKCF